MITITGTITAAAAILLLMLESWALITPSGALAVSDRYLAGWNQGLHDAQNGVYNDCGDHTKELFRGYQDGYNANIGNFNSGIQQSQSSSVNIKGDNNRVTVNQGQAFGSDEGSNVFKGQLPLCILLCVGIQR